MEATLERPPGPGHRPSRLDLIIPTGWESNRYTRPPIHDPESSDYESVSDLSTADTWELKHSNAFPPPVGPAGTGPMPPQAQARFASILPSYPNANRSASSREQSQTRHGKVHDRHMPGTATPPSLAQTETRKPWPPPPPPPPPAAAAFYGPPESVDSSSYFSDDAGSYASTSSEDDPLALTWRAVNEKRQEILSIRGEMQRVRQKLRRQRTTKDSADNAFMALVRPLLLKSQDQPSALEMLSAASLDDRVKEMQITRTNYHDLEMTYESLEERLNQEEIDLDLMERRFINALYPPSISENRPPVLEPIDDQASDVSRPIDLLGISATREDDVHPLYTEFMASIAELDLAKERLEDLRLKKDAVEYERENLDRINKLQANESATQHKSLSDEDLEFLRDFDEEARMAEENVALLDEEVARLKKECEEMRVIPKHVPFHELYSFQPDVDEDMSIANELIREFDPKQNPNREVLLSHRYPLLLTNPYHLLSVRPVTAKAALKTAHSLLREDSANPIVRQRFEDAQKEWVIDALITQPREEDKSDYINRWLLQRLRTTPMEATLLCTVFESFLKIINVRKWQEDVLMYWTRDSANYPPDFFAPPATAEAADLFSKKAASEGGRRVPDYSDRKTHRSCHSDSSLLRLEKLESLPYIGSTGSSASGTYSRPLV